MSGVRSFQTTELLTMLASRGWERTAVESDGPWWWDETWVVESKWAPEGTRVYMTFLVDPMHEGPRKHGESVLAVAVSRDQLTSAGGADLRFYICRGWREEAKKLLESLEQFRVKKS